jgi:hypothetical protein
VVYTASQSDRKGVPKGGHEGAPAQVKRQILCPDPLKSEVSDESSRDCGWCKSLTEPLDSLLKFEQPSEAPPFAA